MEYDEKIQLLRYFFFVVRLSKGESRVAESARDCLERYEYKKEWWDYLDKI